MFVYIYPLGLERLTSNFPVILQLKGFLAFWTGLKKKKQKQPLPPTSLGKRWSKTWHAPSKFLKLTSPS